MFYGCSVPRSRPHVRRVLQNRGQYARQWLESLDEEKRRDAEEKNRTSQENFAQRFANVAPAQPEPVPPVPSPGGGRKESQRASMRTGLIDRFLRSPTPGPASARRVSAVHPQPDDS